MSEFQLGLIRELSPRTEDLVQRHGDLTGADVTQPSQIRSALLWTLSPGPLEFSAWSSAERSDALRVEVLRSVPFGEG